MLIMKVVPQGADSRNLPRERDTFSVSHLPQKFLPTCVSVQGGFVNLTFFIVFLWSCVVCVACLSFLVPGLHFCQSRDRSFFIR